MHPSSGMIHHIFEEYTDHRHLAAAVYVEKVGVDNIVEPDLILITMSRLGQLSDQAAEELLQRQIIDPHTLCVIMGSCPKLAHRAATLALNIETLTEVELGAIINSSPTDRQAVLEILKRER